MFSLTWCQQNLHICVCCERVEWGVVSTWYPQGHGLKFLSVMSSSSMHSRHRCSSSIAAQLNTLTLVGVAGNMAPTPPRDVFVWECLGTCSHEDEEERKERWNQFRTYTKILYVPYVHIYITNTGIQITCHFSVKILSNLLVSFFPLWSFWNCERRRLQQRSSANSILQWLLMTGISRMSRKVFKINTRPRASPALLHAFINHFSCWIGDKIGVILQTNFRNDGDITWNSSRRNFEVLPWYCCRRIA